MKQQFILLDFVPPNIVPYLTTSTISQCFGNPIMLWGENNRKYIVAMMMGYTVCYVFLAFILTKRHHEKCAELHFICYCLRYAHGRLEMIPGLLGLDLD